MNILVVDDESIILNAVTRVLLKQGHTVFSLSSGSGVLEKMEEVRPEVVFLDVKLPGYSGIDILKTIKVSYPSTKVVMMSGYTAPESIQESKLLGADAFLKKPFDDIFEITRIVNTF